jgi:hypothetical protein
MNAKIFTGTLIGPEGQTVGRFVKYETAHNLQAQIENLLETLTMIAQADNLVEAVGIAVDVLDAHQKAVAAGGSSH